MTCSWSSVHGAELLQLFCELKQGEASHTTCGVWEGGWCVFGEGDVMVCWGWVGDGVVCVWRGRGCVACSWSRVSGAELLQLFCELKQDEAFKHNRWGGHWEGMWPVLGHLVKVAELQLFCVQAQHVWGGGGGGGVLGGYVACSWSFIDGAELLQLFCELKQDEAFKHNRFEWGGAGGCCVLSQWLQPGGTEESQASRSSVPHLWPLAPHLYLGVHIVAAVAF
jgi:hypothetical protein